MADLTEMIDEMIRCPKRIIKAERRKLSEKNRSRRNNIELESEDGKYKFTMFLRQSSEFMEDFSVGLRLNNSNEFFNTKKSAILIRFQGPHDSKQDFGSDPHHSYHIHKLSEDDIAHKRYGKPSNAGVTSHFSSFNEAIVHFCQVCAIMNLSEYIDLYNKEIDGQISIF